MKSLIFWILIAGTLYFIARSLVADIRLCQERRDGAPAWKVWLSPWRYFSENVYTEAGERARRDALRSTGWALLLGLGAAVMSSLYLAEHAAMISNRTAELALHLAGSTFKEIIAVRRM